MVFKISWESENSWNSFIKLRKYGWKYEVTRTINDNWKGYYY